MRPAPIALVSAIILLQTATLAPARQRHLTFRDRVEAQRAIEQVYHAHQLGTRRSFDDAAPASLLEKKVITYLKQSAALDTIWATPVTGEMLRAEAERMARESRMPARLRELYAALGNDPVLIQECLVRPALAERMVRGRFAADSGLRARHGSRQDWWAGVAPGLNEWDVTQVAFDAPLPVPAGVDAAGAAGQAASCPPPDDVWQNASLDNPVEAAPKAAGHQSLWTGTIMLVWNRSALLRYDPATETWTPAARLELFANHTLVMRSWTGSKALLWGFRATGATKVPAGAIYDPAADGWAAISTTGAPSPRIAESVVWTGTEMIVWGGVDTNATSTLGDGARYSVATDTWTPVAAAAAPAARGSHSAIWTGSRMIVWAGANVAGTKFNSGGRYDPVTDTWIATAITAQTPGARTNHQALWSGQEMIIIGGDSDPVPFAGRYDPVANTWQATAQLTSRHGSTAVWTGTQAIVWGGSVPAGDPFTGALYDPVSNSWSPASLTNAPAGRLEHTAVWTGTEMVVHGGRISGSPINSYGRYSPASDSWTPGVPAPRLRSRASHAAVWTGSLMLIWGGTDFTTGIDSGLRYDPALDAWTPTSLQDAPAPRPTYDATWTGDEMIIWGFSLPGGRYDPMADSWSPVSTIGEPSPRAEYTMVWTGSRMIVWGGNGGGGASNDGALYDPVKDTWSPTSTVGAPVPRYLHTAVWTGSRMIVWGGCITPIGAECSGGAFLSGGLYDPATDTWTQTSEVGAPSARARHTAVWTGSLMVVWGGGVDTVLVNTGGRYNPSTDTWSATNPSGAPGARREHTAVWTGSRMIVWGGASSVTPQPSGSRYDPATNAWAPVSAVAAPEMRQWHSSVWTGSDMIVWGGYNGNGALNDGGIYKVGADADADTDGVGICAGDCDDLHASVRPGAPQVCGDGLNNDCLHPSWPSLSGTNEADDDGDSLTTCQGDCNDADAAAWSTPGEVADLEFSPDGLTLTWMAPAAPGGLATRYDTLRTPDANDFDASATCVESDDGSDTSAPEAATPAPGEVFYYLVRAENGCPGGLGAGPLGESSAGVPRTGRMCP